MEHYPRPFVLKMHFNARGVDKTGKRRNFVNVIDT